LEDRQTQAVVVSTPAASHFRIAKQCLDAGKDVLVEKPLALTVHDAEELTGIAQRKGRILMVGHTFLYNMSLRKTKEVIDRAEIGKIYYIKAVRSHLGLIREDVNAIWDLATHDVSIFDFLLGIDPIEVHAVGMSFLQPKREDVAFIAFRYPAHLGHIHVSWADSNKQRSIEIVGSKGRILFDDLNTLEPVRIFEKGIELDHDVANFGEYKYLLRDGDIISPRIKMQEPLNVQSEHFIDCVANRSQPLTDGLNGVRVVRVMCRIEEAIKSTKLWAHVGFRAQ